MGGDTQLAAMERAMVIRNFFYLKDTTYPLLDVLLTFYYAPCIFSSYILFYFLKYFFLLEKHIDTHTHTHTQTR